MHWNNRQYIYFLYNDIIDKTYNNDTVCNNTVSLSTVSLNIVSTPAYKDHIKPRANSASILNQLDLHTVDKKILLKSKTKTSKKSLQIKWFKSYPQACVVI